MNSEIKLQTSRKAFLGLMMFSASMLCLVVYFDVPIARQVIGFVFLTTIPGFIIVQLLGIWELSKLEKILISVGLSIVFLMISGLLLNEISPLLGFSRPLQNVPLIAILIGFTIVGGVLLRIKGGGIGSWKFEFSKHDFLMLLPFGLIALSVLGAFYVNTYDNNMLLMLVLVLIPLLFAILVLSKERSSSKLYVVAIFVIALSLLLHSSLISKNLVSFGSDSHLEFFVFKHTEINQRWLASSYGDVWYGRFAAMLSITVLPTFYSSILNLDSALLFKTIYPLIFAFVPIAFYSIWQKYVGKKYALIAVFLLLSQITFYTEMLGVNRQIIAELFFSLLLLVILNNKIKTLPKMILFVLFSFGLISSHYGLSLIFLSFIAAAFIYTYARKQMTRTIKAFEIVSFLVVMFFWYVFTSQSATFESMLSFGQHVVSQSGDFFNPATRGSGVLIGLGLGSAPTMWNVVSRGFAYATELLIIIALIGLITRKLKNPFHRTYLFLVFTSAVILVALIVVPGLANTLNITRFYHILLFFLAPLCVIGADFFVGLLRKRKSHLAICILLLAILIPYFLFQTGFMYEVTESGSYSLSISKNRLSVNQLFINYGYLDAGSISGAMWLSKNVNQTKSLIYADEMSIPTVLWSYGLIYKGNTNLLSNYTLLKGNATIYLDTLNTKTQSIYSWSGTSNVSQLLFFNFSDLSKVYDNWYSQIYQNSP